MSALAAFANSIRPALQGEPADVAAWALNFLHDHLGLSDEEVTFVATAIYTLVKEMGERTAERDQRIAAGEERVCARCGCSESNACDPAGCVWATDKLCSRCV